MKKIVASFLLVMCLAVIAALSQPVITPPPFVPPSAPTVTAACVNQGSTLGGDAVVLTGTGFMTATAVNFGATSAGTAWWINSDTSITISSPAASAGTVNITVTNPAGTSATGAGNQYTYVTPNSPAGLPTITSIIPNSDSTAGGSGFYINGTNFNAGGGISNVMVDGVAANYFVYADWTITASAPAHAATGGTPVHVTVVNSAGTSATTCHDLFTYGTAPTIPAIPGTATRPATNTGTGWFMRGRGIYDANGNRFIPIGSNIQFSNLSGSPPDGEPDRWLAKANIERFGAGFNQVTWDNSANNGTFLNETKYFNVPVPTTFYATAKFTATIDNGSGAAGTILHVSASPAIIGQIALGTDSPAGMQIVTGPATNANIISFGSGSGGAGTYNLDTSFLVSTPTAMVALFQVSGNTSLSTFQAAYRSFSDDYNNGSTNTDMQYHLWDNTAWFDVANEWGPNVFEQPNATFIRTSWIAAVTAMRNAGYKGVIVADAGGSGQGADQWPQDAVAIEAADPQHNVIFNIHVYSAFDKAPACMPSSGCTFPYDRTLNTLAQMTVPLFIEEFGCIGCGVSSATLTPDDIMTSANNYQVGWMAWVYDDTSCTFNELQWFTGSSGCPAQTGPFCYFDSTSMTQTLSARGIDIIQKPSIGMQAQSQFATIFTPPRPSIPACFF